MPVTPRQTLVALHNSNIDRFDHDVLVPFVLRSKLSANTTIPLLKAPEVPEARDTIEITDIPSAKARTGYKQKVFKQQGYRIRYPWLVQYWISDLQPK